MAFERDEGEQSEVMPLRLLSLLCFVSAATAAVGPVTAPPAELKLDPFYKKYVSAGGLVELTGSVSRG